MHRDAKDSTNTEKNPVAMCSKMFSREKGNIKVAVQKQNYIRGFQKDYASEEQRELSLIAEKNLENFLIPNYK